MERGREEERARRGDGESDRERGDIGRGRRGDGESGRERGDIGRGKREHSRS